MRSASYRTWAPFKRSWIEYRGIWPKRAPGLLTSRPAAPQSIAGMLGAFPKHDHVPPFSHQQGLVEPLSERELEVLALLGERDSNKEIAAHLFIAPSTVKRHTLNIYRKLEVSDRRAAVTRARELALYSDGSTSPGK